MGDEICAGIVGLGLAATAHSRGYRSHPAARVLAVCDSDGLRAAAFGEQYGIERVYTSYAELLADHDLNVIDIATPTFLHAQMTRQAAQAGKHIHCEKPFCRSVSEGMAAVRAVERAGVKLLVGETYVFHRERRNRPAFADSPAARRLAQASAARTAHQRGGARVAAGRSAVGRRALSVDLRSRGAFLCHSRISDG